MGRRVGLTHRRTSKFPATSDGYASLLAWMRSFGRLTAVGVEGTGSYGAGLARHLASHKIAVVEVDRPVASRRPVKQGDATRSAHSIRHVRTPTTGTDVTFGDERFAA